MTDRKVNISKLRFGDLLNVARALNNDARICATIAEIYNLDLDRVEMAVFELEAQLKKAKEQNE